MMVELLVALKDWLVLTMVDLKVADLAARMALKLADVMVAK
jgi:hypothetical protein